MRKSLLAPLAAALALSAFPALSAVEYSSVEVDVAPPPIRTEVVPPRYEQRDGRWRMYAGGWDRRDADEEHGGLRNKVHALKERIHHDDD